MSSSCDSSETCKKDDCNSCNSCNDCGRCDKCSAKSNLSCLDESSSDKSCHDDLSDLTKYSEPCCDEDDCNSCDNCNDCDKCDKKREKLSKCHPLHDLQDSSESCDDNKKSKCRKFIFDFACKDGHPWACYNKGSKSIHVNGHNGPVLKLRKGFTYYFCAKSADHDGHGLILTDSPAGGCDAKRLKDSFKPCNKGTVVYKVDDDTPKYFFYQDVKNEFAGGLAMVSDE